MLFCKNFNQNECALMMKMSNYYLSFIKIVIIKALIFNFSVINNSLNGLKCLKTSLIIDKHLDHY